MRIMLTPWPNPAHLYPMVPLVWALQSAGHEVRVASHPVLAETTTSCGLPAVSLGDMDSVSMPRGPGRPQPRSVREKLERITEDLALDPAECDPWNVFYQFMLPSMWDFHPVGASAGDEHVVVDRMVDFARDWRPDLVLWDPCFPGGAVAARASGAAHARILWGLDYFAWTIDRFTERGTRPGPVAGENPLVETVRPVAERYGVEVDDELLLGQWTVDPTPTGIRLLTKKVRTVSVRWVPYSAQAPTPDWLSGRPDRPRVAVSLGLSQRTYFKGGWDYVPDLFEVMGELDIEVVATLNKDQLAEVSRIPGNVRTIDYVPLNQLLPSCTVAIHHGGMGTFAAATAANLPQLITDSDVDYGMITIEEDGMEWAMAAKHIESAVTAKYVVDRGAGLALDIKKLSVDGMRKQLVRVLDEPQFRAGAAALYADVIGTPSVNDIVPVLERLTAEHR